MEFAWNTQKNKLSDVKGKEIEQERKSDNLKNDDIDKSKTHLNYDLIQSNLNLYQRVKNRVDAVRQNSRIQKNSVVMYSNVITVNKNEFQQWGTEKTKAYFQSVTEFFQNEFGKENVVSAKVHLDETTPHMHLHFVPISQEGKLQARKVMTPSKINKIHSDAPKFLQSKGFDVERGKGETGRKNIKDIHKYKLEKLVSSVEELEQKLDVLNKTIYDLSNIKPIEELDVSKFDIKNKALSKNKLVIDKSEFNTLLESYSLSIDRIKELENTVLKLKMNNLDLDNKILFFEKREKDLIEDRAFYIKEKDRIKKYEKILQKKEERNTEFYKELFSKEQSLIKEKDAYKSKVRDEFNFEINAKNEVINDLNKIVLNLCDEKKKAKSLYEEERDYIYSMLNDENLYYICKFNRNKELLNKITNTYKIDLKPFTDYSYDKKDIYIAISNYKELNLKKTDNYTFNEFDKIISNLKKGDSKSVVAYIFNKKNFEYLYGFNINPKNENYLEDLEKRINSYEGICDKPILNKILTDFKLEKKKQLERNKQISQSFSYEMEM
ncbi:plasmid recombination-like protein [[Clostridium] sordellii]|uniref:MobV family relaxase n=2 Tax=Paraclostridium sordellii TaxID=1505 RepID=UPI0005DD3F3C|nr:MobV family relaxase [Paeniclostridium sordellii]CEP46570.1 plasmid recombination-like protein [[Clostridium] sordellii] [Paeniclostridium sordellii]